MNSASMSHAASPGTTPVGRCGLYVQYGCGLSAPEGWLNFDASPRLLIEQIPVVRNALGATVGLVFPANARMGDIVRGLSVSEGSAAGIFCSHVLEHVARDDLAAALRNTLKMLKSGGIFRLVVPDLYWRAERYLTSAARGDRHAADALMSACLLGRRAKAKSLTSLVRHHFGNSSHLWMYDFAALKGLLEDAGFTGVRRCELGDARDPMFALVEDRRRFFEGSERELAIEAIKPIHDAGFEND